MAFFTRNKHKNIATSPEITTSSSPLMYENFPSASSSSTPAASAYEPSIARSNSITAYESSIGPSVAPLLRESKQKSISKNRQNAAMLQATRFMTTTDWTGDKPTKLVADESPAETDGDGEADGASEREGGQPRPKTPEQGTRYLAWRSYRNLLADHPVFKSPDAVREKYYAKGVDPVVKAEMDSAVRGKRYGEHHPLKGLNRRAQMVFGNPF